MTFFAGLCEATLTIVCIIGSATSRVKREKWFEKWRFSCSTKSGNLDASNNHSKDLLWLERKIVCSGNQKSVLNTMYFLAVLNSSWNIFYVIMTYQCIIHSSNSVTWLTWNLFQNCPIVCYWSRKYPIKLLFKVCFRSFSLVVLRSVEICCGLFCRLVHIWLSIYINACRSYLCEKYDQVCNFIGKYRASNLKLEIFVDVILAQRNSML